MKNQKIEKEDIVLYVFTLLLVGSVATFLYKSQQYQIDLLEQSYEQEVPVELRTNAGDSLELIYYKMQMQQTNKISGHSSRALVSSTTIRYIGFLIGITMVFLGAIMIIRGIRNTPTKLEGTVGQEASFKFASSSPGIIFSFFGLLVLIATIWKTGEVSFKVYPIYHYNQYIETQSDDTGTGEQDDEECIGEECDDVI